MIQVTNSLVRTSLRIPQQHLWIGYLWSRKQETTPPFFLLRITLVMQLEPLSLIYHKHTKYV